MPYPKARRSRTGCVTCRGRKVRCDEEHPVCRACTRLCLSCNYETSPSKNAARRKRRSYQPKFRVRFVNTDPSEGDSQHVNQNLNTASDGDYRANVPTPPMGNGTNVSPSSDDLLDTPPGRRGQLRYDHYPRAEPLAMSTPLEALDGNSDSTSGGNNTLCPAMSSIPLTQHSNGGPNLMALDGIGGFLNSITFQGGMGPLWDSLPAFDDFQESLGANMPLFENEVRFETPQADVVSRPRSPPLRRPSPRQMVTIRPEDQEPLHHYLSTMVQFAKIRSSASDNIYCYIFTNMALTHAPLYEAILSWAALHLAHIKSHSMEDAELRYKRAIKLLNDDAQAAEYIDLTLVTVWILLQYELFSASGVDEFIRLLNYAADVVEAVFWNNDAATIRDHLGPVGIRMLMWLSAYEVRAALFGHSCRLLRCLKMHSSVYDIIEGYGESPGHRVVSSIEFGTAELKACLRLVLQINIARGSCVLLGKWQGDIEGTQIAWEAVRSNLKDVQAEAENTDAPAAKLAWRVAEGDLAAPIAVNVLEYNWMQLVASFYSSLMLYQIYCPELVNAQDSELDVPGWPNTSQCAARIIRLSRHATLSRPDSPQAIWPPLLFQAGVETDDPIYQSWVIGAFAQAESWGPNLRKARRLLERVIESRRGNVKAPVDIVTLMDGMGGPFIV